MLDKTKLDEKSVWNRVKETRKSFLSQYIEPKCQDTLLSNNLIKENINTLKKKLNMNEIDAKDVRQHSLEVW